MQKIRGIYQFIFTLIQINREKREQSKIRDFARENPIVFMEIAVDEIGCVEFAEYLHDTYNLLELIEGLEAEVISDLEDQSDYYHQMINNYRYL